MRDRSNIYQALAFYGAPLLDVRPVRSLALEEVLPRALELAAEDATVLRSLPLVLARNLDCIDWNVLSEEACRIGQGAATGMLLELTGELLGDESLLRHAEAFERAPGDMRHFFQPRGPFDERLARSRTPEVARRWGFWMNMPEESFRSLLEKHHG